MAAPTTDAAHGGSQARRLAGLVYGTIVVLAVLVAFAAAPGVDARSVLAVVVTTNVVLWFAHVYAHVLAGSVATAHRARWHDVVTTARHEVPIVLASVLPAVALLLGALGLVSDRASFRIAFAIGLVTLAVQAVAYARIERFGPWATAATVGLNVAVGLALAVLEAIVSH